jgi:hypothetical protein
MTTRKSVCLTCSTLAVLVSIASFTPVMLQENQELQECNIRPQEVGKIEPKDNFVCGLGPLARWKHLFMLSKPSRTNIVAVVSTDETGQTALNPVGFDYGPIPPLSKITRAQLATLWGQTLDDPMKSECTYCLFTGKKQEFFIDATFEGNNLKKYRIRSSCLNSPSSWSAVE